MKNPDASSVGRESDKFMLRLPDGMRDRIAALAKQNGRSMNAEIIARMEDGNSMSTHALIEAIARLNVQLAGAELELERQKAEYRALEANFDAAVRLLGRTQYRHDPNYEILVAKNEPSVDERAKYFDHGAISKALERYQSALDELAKVKKP